MRIIVIIKVIIVNKIDKTVIKETKYIAYWVILLSLIMESVFLILTKWDYTVLLGNILGGGASILNFFLMGLTVQKAVTMEEKDAKARMKVSQLYRNLMLLVVAVIGVTIKCFNMWAVILPLLFPRIAIVFRPFFDRKTINKKQ